MKHTTYALLVRRNKQSLWEWAYIGATQNFHTRKSAHRSNIRRNLQSSWFPQAHKYFCTDLFFYEDQFQANHQFIALGEFDSKEESNVYEELFLSVIPTLWNRNLDGQYKQSLEQRRKQSLLASNPSPETTKKRIDALKRRKSPNSLRSFSWIVSLKFPRGCIQPLSMTVTPLGIRQA